MTKTSFIGKEKVATAISLDNVVKRYGKLIAVNGVSFDVEEGEIFGLVGPNGAGKTTLIELIEGLRLSDSGYISVFGLDPLKDGPKLKEIMGAQLQATSIYERIRVREAMELFASFYPKTVDIDELLHIFSLTEKSKSYYKDLSGGLKQRLAIALALVNDPQILFLDELTTGLDPRARRNMWDFIQGVREKGKTIFLTTHYMEEAERLCDRVGIMDQGRLIALGSPKDLIQGISAESKISFSLDQRIDIKEVEYLEGMSKLEQIGDKLILYTNDPGKVLEELVTLAHKKGWELIDLNMEKPNLEDVFLTLTGKEIRD